MDLRKKALILIVVSYTLTSCESKSNTEILTSAQWDGWPIEEVLDKDKDGDWVLKYDLTLEPESTIDCMADDYVWFNSNGTIDFHHGPKRCDPYSGPIATTYTWRFIEDEKKMLLNGDTMIVEALRTGKLQLSRMIDKNYGVRLTFKR